MPNKDARKDKLKTAGLVAGGAVFGKMVGASVAAGAVTTTTGTATGTVVATACGGITLAAATPYLIIGGAMCLAYSLLSDEKKSPDIVEVVNAERAPALDDVVLHAPVLQNLRDAVQDDQIAHHAVAPLLVRAARAHVERQATLILDDDAVLDTNPCTFEQLASMNDDEKKSYLVRFLPKSRPNPLHRVILRTEECQICLGVGGMPDILFLPCGHLAACSACELSWIVTTLNQRIARFAVQTLGFTRETVMDTAAMLLLLSQYCCFLCRQTVTRRVNTN